MLFFNFINPYSSTTGTFISHNTFEFQHLHLYITFRTYYIAFIILGMSISLSSPVVILPVVIAWFRKRPSLAMGIVLSGAAVAGLLVPGIVWMVDTMGWRSTLFGFAIGAAVICIPLSCLVKNPPAIDHEPTDQSVPAKPVSSREVAREVVKRRNFWLLSLAVAFTGFASAAIATHQIPYLASVGISRAIAGWVVVVFSLSSIVGRLAFGWLGDIIDKRICFNISALLQTVGLAVYAYSSSVTLAFISMLLFGLGFGGIATIRNGLQLDYFGLDGYAVVQGLLLIFVTVGFMAAPPLAGWIFDSVHTYRPAWIAFSALSIISVPLIMAMTKPKEPKIVN